MNAFPSKLDNIIYRCWVYIILPIFFTGSLYLIFSEKNISNSLLWFPIVCLLQLIGLHYKAKLAYWTNYFFVLVLSLILYLFKEYYGKSILNSIISGEIPYKDGIINSGLMGVVYGLLLFSFFYRWYKIKSIFYPIKIEDIDWNASSVDNKERYTDNPTKIVWGVIALFAVGLVYVIYTNTQHSKQNNIIKVEQKSEQVKPVEQSTTTAIISPQSQSLKMLQPQTQQNVDVFSNAVREQIPELANMLNDPDFISFLNTKEIDFTGNKAITLVQYVGEKKDTSLIPKIRVLIDEYKNIKSANANANANATVNLAFGCNLTDGRNVYVSKTPDNKYLYVIFGKKGNVELNFWNSAQQIQQNSLLHRNGVTLVMQNGTYQYRISGQGTKTTLFVYNGDKGISTHYCQDNKDYWNLDNLPLLSVNAGSASHIKYCKQIINEGLYLAKMSKHCPNEMQGVSLSVEDTALFFDSEGCGYLIQNNQKQQQDMVLSLSNKLNKSIEDKSKKLGSQFCPKESVYARKMAEKYQDFFNRR